MALNKVYNTYALALGPLYAKMPKAVVAAIAVSAVTCGGDFLSEATDRVLIEWLTLHENGIIPQKPPKEAWKARERAQAADRAEWDDAGRETNGQPGKEGH